MQDSVDILPLDTRHMGISTATGRFLGNRMGVKEIINISAIGLAKIRKEKADLVDYVTKVTRKFGFSIELHDHL